MTRATKNNKISKLIISPIFIDMMNIKHSAIKVTKMAVMRKVFKREDSIGNHSAFVSSYIVAMLRAIFICNGSIYISSLCKLKLLITLNTFVGCCAIKCDKFIFTRVRTADLFACFKSVTMNAKFFIANWARNALFNARTSNLFHGDYSFSRGVFL